MKRFLALLLAFVSLAACAAEGADDLYDPAYASIGWTYTAESAVSKIGIGDVDGDGSVDAVAGLRDVRVIGIDKRGSPLFTINVAGQVMDLHVKDMDEDGIDEIFIGPFHRVYATKRGIVMWSHSIDTLISSVYSDDIDMDGKTEVIAGSTMDIKPISHVVAFDSEGNVKWRVSTGNADPRIVRTMKFDDEKITVVGTFIHTLALPTNVYGINNSGKIIWSYQIDGAAGDIYVDDFNGEEVAVVGGIPSIFLLNPNGTLRCSYTKTRAGGIIESVYAFDLDGDGKKEILAGSSLGDLYVIDDQCNLVWEKSIGGTINKVLAADITGKGFVHIFVGTTTFFVLDANGNIRWRYATGGDIKDMGVADFEGDGVKDIVAGSGSGKVYDFKINLVPIKEEEAGEYWDAAWNYYSDRAFDNATDLFDKARAIYLETGNTDKVGKCDEMLSDILIKEEAETRGDELYNESLEKFNLGEYGDAAEKAEEAKRKYSEGGCTSKADLAKKVSADSYTMMLERYSRMFEQNYNTRDYENAIVYAAKMKEVYTLTNNNTGMKWCDNMLNELNTSLELFRNNSKLADENYREALMAYNSSKYSDALALFETASGYFNITENMSYVKECENWIVLTRARIDEETKASYIRYSVILLGVILVLFILYMKRDSLRVIYSNARAYAASVKLPQISLTFQKTQPVKAKLSEEEYSNEAVTADRAVRAKIRDNAAPSTEIDRELIRKMVQQEMVHETVREEMKMLKKEIIDAVREEISRGKRR